MDALLPRALTRGDEVAIVSPSGPLSRPADLERGIRRLKDWGLRPRVMPHALDQLGYLAGDDKNRAADFQAALEDADIRAILCVRGGYGAMRILDRLDFGPARQDPKPIVGYSDITALLAAAWQEVGLVGFHGPMVAQSAAMAMDTPCERLQRSLLMDAETTASLPAVDDERPPHVLRPGRAEGRLAGGNLSLCVALIGTPWEIDTTGAMLFLEDTGEVPYRIDRMLTQLALGGFLARAAGIVLGDFHVDETPLGSEHPDITRVLHDRLGSLRVPVAHGFPFGHRPRSWSLPFGTKARLDATDESAVPTLRLLEPSTR